MKLNNKYAKALILFPVIFLISCADITETNEDAPVWDATNYTMYNEFMTCTAGENYSQVDLNEAIVSWRGTICLCLLGMKRSLVFLSSS